MHAPLFLGHTYGLLKVLVSHWWAWVLLLPRQQRRCSAPLHSLVCCLWYGRFDPDLASGCSCPPYNRPTTSIFSILFQQDLLRIVPIHYTQEFTQSIYIWLWYLPPKNFWIVCESLQFSCYCATAIHFCEQVTYSLESKKKTRSTVKSATLRILTRPKYVWRIHTSPMTVHAVVGSTWFG